MAAISNTDAETKRHHQVPRLSASKMERVAACQGAHARAWEMHMFRQANGLPGPESGSDAARGTQVHELLSRVPFVSASLGLGDGGAQKLTTYRRVMKAAEESGFKFESSAEKWFCVNAIRKRDRLIEEVVIQAGRVDGEMEFMLDARRMGVKFPMGNENKSAQEEDAELTGLADVFVQIPRADGGKTVVLCDYKSLYGEHAPSERNPQLATLAALARLNDSAVDRVYVSLIGAGQSNEEIDVAEYTGPDLDRVVSRLREIAVGAEREARALVNGVVLNDGKLPEDVQERVNALSVVGDHCHFCDGMACCQKLRQQLGIFNEETKTAEARLSPAREALKSKKETMTPTDLTEALRDTRGVVARFKIFKKLDEELTSTMRELLTQLTAKGESLPGVKLKPGNRKPVVREFVQQENAASEEEESLYPSIPEPFDASPRAVFEKLAPVIAQASGGEAPDFDAFLGACFSLSATQTRGYLAGLASMDESQVFEQLLAPLGKDNPFELKADRPSVEIGNLKAEQVRSAKV